MSHFNFIISVSYDDDGYPPRPEAVAEIIKAGLYKTYVNPARTDTGLSSVSIYSMTSFGSIGEGENMRATYTRGKQL